MLRNPLWNAGNPCIYYGSEWGEEGVKAPDNDYALRPCFDAPKPNELTDFISRLIEVRCASDALCNGSYRNVSLRIISLSLNAAQKQNASLLPSTLLILTSPQEMENFRGSYIDLLKTGDSSETAPQTLNGQLSMPAYSVQYLKML